MPRLQPDSRKTFLVRQKKALNITLSFLCHIEFKKLNKTYFSPLRTVNHVSNTRPHPTRPTKTHAREFFVSFFPMAQRSKAPITPQSVKVNKIQSTTAALPATWDIPRIDYVKWIKRLLMYTPQIFKSTPAPNSDQEKSWLWNAATPSYRENLHGQKLLRSLKTVNTSDKNLELSGIFYVVSLIQCSWI